MGQLTIKQLKSAAGRIKLGRNDLAVIFDALVEKETPPGQKFMVVDAVRPADESPALAILKAAKERGFVNELIEQIGLAGGLSHAEEAVRFALQAAVNPELGFFAVGLAQPALLAAARRVCRITIEGDAGDVQGSGFLIGPQSVITSYHVVKDLLGADDKPINDSHKKILVEFDRLSLTGGGDDVPVADNWLDGFSSTHPGEAPTTTALDFDAAGDPAYANHLDFAVIRLSRPVGRERGFYALDAGRRPRTEVTSAQVTLFQHPGGTKMMMTTGIAKALWPGEVGSRLRHTANSTSGSSGGLLLDRDFVPIALHQCGIKDGNELINGAIPTYCIAATGSAAPDVSGVDPLWKLADGRPVVGRLELQTAFYDAITGEKRIVAVSGSEGTGRSFSLEILKAMLSEGSHLLVRLPAAEISADALTFAGDFIERIHPDGPQARDRLPSPGDADTAQQAWIRDVLYPAFVDLLRQAAGNRTLWLAIDELDANPLANTSVRQLLEKCYLELQGTNFLRFVLAGLTGVVPAAPTELVSYVELEPFNEQDIRQHLQLVFVAKGKEPGPNEVETLAKIVINDATRKGGDWNATIAGFLQSVIHGSI